MPGLGLFLTLQRSPPPRWPHPSPPGFPAAPSAPGAARLPLPCRVALWAAPWASSGPRRSDEVKSRLHQPAAGAHTEHRPAGIDLPFSAEGNHFTFHGPTVEGKGFKTRRGQPTKFSTTERGHPLGTRHTDVPWKQMLVQTARLLTRLPSPRGGLVLQMTF